MRPSVVSNGAVCAIERLAGVASSRTPERVSNGSQVVWETVRNEITRHVTTTAGGVR